MYDTTDTIAAIATPLGESGIGVIRISGSHAYDVGDAIFRSPSGKPLAQRQDRHGSMHRAVAQREAENPSDHHEKPLHAFCLSTNRSGWLFARRACALAAGRENG